VLPDHEFRQAVLKAAFMGISVARIMRLEERADAELTRMLLSYVTEREVAGRSVPPDIWPVVAAHPAAGLVAKLCGYLEHPAEAHRVGAAVALGRIRDVRARPFLEDRLARETDAVARRALERAIA
jgi:HEAT repeat protein